MFLTLHHSASGVSLACHRHGRQSANATDCIATSSADPYKLTFSMSASCSYLSARTLVVRSLINFVHFSGSSVGEVPSRLRKPLVALKRNREEITRERETMAGRSNYQPAGRFLIYCREMIRCAECSCLRILLTRGVSPSVCINSRYIYIDKQEIVVSARWEP